jgi:hypothetical protein
MFTTLLLDVGDVLTDIPWNSLDRFGALAGRTFPFRGALKPEAIARDPAFCCFDAITHAPKQPEEALVAKAEALYHA